MSIKSTIQSIKQERAALAQKLEEIAALDFYSDSKRASLRQEAIDQALARLVEIGSSADEELAQLAAKAKARNEFVYDDPQLLAAIQLIKTFGKNLPDGAAKGIVSDFKDKPSVMTFLSDLFEQNGRLDAAIAAKEAAQQAELSESFPTRAADFIYFVTHADPTANADFAKIENELEKFEAEG